MSDLDAKPCVADLDAHCFCRGYTPPLAMMGVALDRYLPGRNPIRVNKTYVIIYANIICALFYRFGGNGVLQVTVLYVRLFCHFDLLY